MEQEARKSQMTCKLDEWGARAFVVKCKDSIKVVSFDDEPGGGELGSLET